MLFDSLPDACWVIQRKANLFFLIDIFNGEECEVMFKGTREDCITYAIDRMDYPIPLLLGDDIKYKAVPIPILIHRDGQPWKTNTVDLIWDFSGEWDWKVRDLIFDGNEIRRDLMDEIPCYLHDDIELGNRTYRVSVPNIS